MSHGLATALRWAGRAFVLFGPYVLVCSLFLPAGVQFLNSAVCPTGTELSNARDLGPGAPDDAKLELVCTSPIYSVSVGPRIMMIVVGSIAIGLILIWISQRASRPSYRAPSGAGVH